MTRRQRILASAELGCISFYEGRDHVEIEFDEHGEPVQVQFFHGVCSGCVMDAERVERVARCCLHDPNYRAATVDEVAVYIGAIP